MNRPLAIAYAITGLAVAISMVAVVAATTGVFAPAPADTTPVEAAPTAAPTAPTPNTGAATAVPSSPDATTGTEFVYVDAPRRGGKHEEHERGERRGHTRGGRGEDHDD